MLGSNAFGSFQTFYIDGEKVVSAFEVLISKSHAKKFKRHFLFAFTGDECLLSHINSPFVDGVLSLSKDATSIGESGAGVMPASVIYSGGQA